MFFSLKQGNFLLINRYLCYATRNFDLNSDYPLIPAQPTDLFIQLIIIQNKTLNTKQSNSNVLE